MEGTDQGQGEGELEVMGLKHFILPFIILGVGFVLATVVFAIELGIKHLTKEPNQTKSIEGPDSEIQEMQNETTESVTKPNSIKEPDSEIQELQKKTTEFGTKTKSIKGPDFEIQEL